MGTFSVTHFIYTPIIFPINNECRSGGWLLAGSSDLRFVPPLRTKENIFVSKLLN